MATVIYNGTVLTPFREIRNGGIVVDQGKIIEVFEGNPNVDVSGSTRIDAGEAYIAPGFVDIHVHGGGGIETTAATPDSIATMCEAHARYGTTAIVPTVSSSPWDLVYRVIDAVKEAKGKPYRGATILGVHLEGPYFSEAQKGSQNSDFLKIPDPSEYRDVLEYWDGIVMMGASPELPGALQLGRELRERGIVAAIAHSDANFDQVVKAVENGYSHITHFYSGCSSVHRENAYRVAGVVEAGYLMDDVTVEVIADGRHLPPSLLKLIFKVKGYNNTALVTDGMAYSGVEMPEQQEVISGDGRKLILEDQVMKLADRTSFAGSVATMDRLVRNMRDLAGTTLLQAVHMATITPARVVGVDDQKGTLSPGKDADIVIFDSALHVKLTMVEGEVVHATTGGFEC